MAEKNIELDSVEVAAAVFGNCDRNIRLLENEFSVTAVCRGTQLRLSGEPANVAAASRAVEGMLLLIENHTPLEDQTVRYCISLAHDGAEKRVKELTEDFVTVTVKGRPIRPKTLGQKEYLNAIRTNAITFGVGPAGTGKTYLAVAMAVKAFKAKDVSRIVLTRPAVEAGEKLGFLTACLICWVPKLTSALWKSRSLRLHRLPICADARWMIPLSFWMRHRTPHRSR